LKSAAGFSQPQRTHTFSGGDGRLARSADIRALLCRTVAASHALHWLRMPSRCAALR
jgi:hypothetical protein